MSSETTIRQKIAELENRFALNEREAEELSDLRVALKCAIQWNHMIAMGTVPEEEESA